MGSIWPIITNKPKRQAEESEQNNQDKSVSIQSLASTLERKLSQILIQNLGRERLEYFCSNTMNVLTRRLAPFLWSYDLQALVLRRRVEAANVVGFELLPNTHWQAPQAGQYVEIAYPVAEEILERAYSISRLNGSSFWITVKRQGKVSSALHANVKVGDRLSLRGPAGEFVYRGQNSVLLICAGSGITPCFAILQALLALPAEQRPQIQFYAQFSQPEDTIFAQSLLAWRERYAGPRFRLDLAYSKAPEAGTCPPLSPEHFAQLFPHLSRQDLYLCGPAGFQTQVQKALETAQFPLERLHLEQFQPPVFNTAELASELEAQALLPEVYFAQHHCRIQMRPQDRHKSLLELGLEHGLNLEKGCRKGYCGTCKLVLHQGQVRGQTQGQAVYLCSAYANSAKVVLGH